MLAALPICVSVYVSPMSPQEKGEPASRDLDFILDPAILSNARTAGLLKLQELLGLQELPVYLFWFQILHQFFHI